MVANNILDIMVVNNILAIQVRKSHHPLTHTKHKV